MSSFFTGWKGSITRPTDAWRRINDKPTEITLKRGSTMLDQQLVRVEYSSSANEQVGENSIPGTLTVTLFGVKNHPTVSDTDIQRGDRFVLENVEYEVMGVITTTGELQAISEASQS